MRLSCRILALFDIAAYLSNMQSAWMTVKEVGPAVNYWKYMYSMRYDVRGRRILMLERSQDVELKELRGSCVSNKGSKCFH